MAPSALSKLQPGKPVRKSWTDGVVDWINFLFGNQTVSTGLPMVLNGGFESDNDADGVPDNWEFVQYTGGTYEILEEGIQGVKSFRMTHPGGGGSNGGGYIQTPDGLLIPVSQNKDVWLSWAHRCSVGVDLGVKVELLWYDEDSQAIGSPSVLYDETTNPTDWLYFAFSGTPPAGARFVRVRLTGGVPGTDPGGAETTDFDDVRIFEPAETGFVFAEDTPGTYEVLVPSTSVWGKFAVKGGGGSGARNTNVGQKAGGGGGAAKGEGHIRIHPGRTLTIVVPAGGAAKTSNGNGNAGAAATITDEDGTALVSIAGGSGGIASASGTGGTGGAAGYAEDLANKRHGGDGSNGETASGAGSNNSYAGGSPALFLTREFFDEGYAGLAQAGSFAVANSGFRGGGGASWQRWTVNGNSGAGGDGLVVLWL